MTAPGWDQHLPAGAGFCPVDLLAAGTLVAAVVDRWAALPDAPVVHDPLEGWLRARDLEARTRTVAGRLHRAGVRTGERVVLSGPNRVALVVAHLACLRLGAVVVPANPAYRQPEVAHLVADSRPRVALVADGGWVTWIRGVDPDVVVASPDVELPDGMAPDLDGAAPGDAALVGYTSGTTGSPKGAVLTQANLLAGAEAVRLAWRWEAGDRLVGCLPLFHMHGLGVGLHGTLVSGASIVLQEGFEPGAVLEAIGRYGATLVFGVPTMYHRLAASARAGELARLRLCVSGSAPLPAELHHRLDAVAGVSVLERYGMTETVMLVSNPYDGERRPGSVGVPLPGVELRLAGDRGEIEVRGPNVFAGYLGRPDETADAFTTDGWFRTGDLGRLDPDGYLRIVGRAKELIISGGYNVHPREVEEVLADHPAVGEVAVAGRPSPEWGEEVIAYVVVRDGAELPAPGDLRAFAADRLAPHKLPRAVVACPALPRNALGKVERHRLPGAATAAPPVARGAAYDGSRRGGR